MYYMTKVVAPETANTMRELAGQMIKPNVSHWKALESAVGYVLHEPHQGSWRSLQTSNPTSAQIQTMWQIRMTRRAFLARLVPLKGWLLTGIQRSIRPYHWVAMRISAWRRHMSRSSISWTSCSKIYLANPLMWSVGTIKGHVPGQELTTSILTFCQHFVREPQKQKKVLGEFFWCVNIMADGATKNHPENKLFTNNDEA